MKPMTQTHQLALLGLSLLLLGSSGCALAAEPTAGASKPNIILILADDLGYSDLGCYGGEIPTPNIDALAKAGLRFTHMANSARCCPTRAALLTGLHPSQAGVPNFQGTLAKESATLAEVLKGAGYCTYAVGKWHVGNVDPSERGFDEYFGFPRDHSTDQWQEQNYKRLPQGRKPELKYGSGKFYATDAFNDYAIEFIRQGHAQRKPWFLYLAHSAPHFPVQAPMDSAKLLLPAYRQGWDVLRQQRFERLKQIGLIHHEGWKLSPLSIVPVEQNDAIANGFGGRLNPSWASLPENRREDLAHRMALYAAMVKHMDAGLGRIIQQLKATGQYDNTLILVLSDNGACYEWGPFGFDGRSRAGETTLSEGDALERMGGPGTHMAYGSAWANLCNTPFRLYKHFAHEGGITTPFIVHWPKGVKQPGRWVRDPAYITDLMPTLIAVSGASYPKVRDGHPVQPMEGISLTSTFTNGNALPERAICIQHQGARSIRKGQWKLVLGKRFPTEAKWELYDMNADPCELNNLAAQKPELVASLSQEWETWAKRVGLTAQPSRTARDANRRAAGTEKP